MKTCKLDSDRKLSEDPNLGKTSKWLFEVIQSRKEENLSNVSIDINRKYMNSSSTRPSLCYLQIVSTGTLVSTNKSNIWHIS